MASGDLSDSRQADKRLNVSLQVKSDIRQGAEVAEGHDCDSFFSADSEEVRLSQIGMHLNLEYGGLNRSIVEHFSDHLKSEIGDSYVFAESFTMDSFHSLPSLLVGDCFVED